MNAIRNAELGDDVFGEDPTVRRLEEKVAAKVALEAGLFVSSGTQANLLSLMSHCERGDEYIAGQNSHIYRWEGGGGAVLGGIQPQPIEGEENGTLDLNRVLRAIKPIDSHHARTRLLCLENTFSGRVLPLPYLKSAIDFTRSHSLKIHLDGARIFNASIQQNVEVQEITRGFDSVSVCLSKGLGAPVGSVLTGSKEFIVKARRWRKMLGGGMRQAGVLAAAGIYALDHHIDRISEDHVNAARLATGLAELNGIEVDPSQVQTNMVFARLKSANPEKFAAQLLEKGITILPDRILRLVTHLNISSQEVDFVIQAFRETLVKTASR